MFLQAKVTTTPQGTAPLESEKIVGGLRMEREWDMLTGIEAERWLLVWVQQQEQHFCF
jgi:hypothetical protein